MSQYERFQKNILRYENEDDIEKQVKNAYNESLVRRVILTNIILFVLHVLYFIIELSSSFYKEYGYTNLYGVIIVFASTIISTIILRTDLDDSGLVCRFTILFNLIFLTIAFTMFSYTSYSALLDSGKNIRLQLIGIPMGSLLLVLLLITPLYSRVDSLIIWLVIIGEYLVLYFLKTGAVMGLFNTILFRVILLLMYLFFRFQIKSHAFSRITISDLGYKIALNVYTDQSNFILNRTALETYMDRIKYQKDVENLGIMLVNIVDFKEYVQQNGYKKGDEMSGEVGLSLLELDPELYVFKFDEDKYTLVFENITKEEMASRSHQILEIIENLKNNRLGEDFVGINISSKIVLKNDDLPNTIDFNLKQTNVLSQKGKSISVDGEIL